jgi:hypothetical protein
VLVTTLSMNARSWLTSSSVPWPLGEERLQELQRLDVEIVGGLVEHQHVGRPGEEPGQQQAVAFAAGERAYRRQRAFGRKEEVAQVAVHVLLAAVDGHRLTAVADGVHHGALGIELFPQLVVVGHLQVGAVAHLAGVRA